MLIKLNEVRGVFLLKCLLNFFLITLWVLSFTAIVSLLNNKDKEDRLLLLPMMYIVITSILVTIAFA